MKKYLFLLCISFISTISQAQDDLLDELNKIQKPVISYASATFKSTRIVSGHSIETVAAKHLDFRISHRFGAVNSGYQQLFGLDQSQIRLGFEFGLTDRLTVGVGRNSYQKTYDYYAKYKLLRQSSGAKLMPVTVALLAAAYTNTLPSQPSARFFNNLERQTYCGQLLIARKFGERVSLQLTPSILHRNKVETENDANTLYSLGMGGRFKLTRRTSFNVEYYYTPTTVGGISLRDPQFKNALSIGFDIETGGHVFQLHFTNSKGMSEKYLIGQTEGTWQNGDIFYGFNISRVFSFDKSARKTNK
ncbi:DUF5777 family beta-barrel protein [Runella sp.]|jgi:hypothetical protein|uniref:DUF5777 family beta-barrel protein n=1 Tax=Runella sp. TaxID=1960881 RepID=UPI002609BD8B|nr:DUF5777 family beta-barrel protein [Runella sp.]